MYKDVWKRFGAKILIIACSVLLLGGVAIAAPRLRAARGTLDLANAASITAQSMMYEVDPVELAKVQGGASMPQGGIGKKQSPQFIDVVFNDGSTATLERYKDFDIVSGEDQISNAGETVMLTIGPSSDPDSQLAEGSGQAQNVSFTIVPSNKISDRSVKSELNPQDYLDVSGETSANGNNYWVVSTLPSSFESTKWSIYYTDPTLGKVPLAPTIDYTVPTGATALGDYSVNLTLKNYTATPSVSAKVMKNINSAEVSVGLDASDAVEVTDNGTPLTHKTHYYIEDETMTSCTIVGNENGGYVGSRPYTYPAKPSNFNPVFDPYEVDYDTALTIENPPAQVWHEDASGNRTPLKYGKDYTIENYRVQSGGTPVPGATAGSVYMDIIGAGDYSGTARGSYRLTRSFANNPKLKVELKPRVADDKFMYDGKVHEKYPEVSFTDSTGLLEQGRDYTVSYKIEQKVGGTIDPATVKDLIHAGTVSVIIKGTGYYTGTLEGSFENGSLQYSIAQNDLSDMDLVLANSLFELTNNVKDKIYDNAYLQLKSDKNVRYKVKPLGGNTPSYSYDADGNDPIKDNDWTDKLVPNVSYYLHVEFFGDYIGTLTVPFRIQEYQDDYITVTFDVCEECGAKNGEDHIYTGKPHTPDILKVTYDAPGSPSTTIPRSEYEGKVVYTNNTKVGTATVEVPVSDKASGRAAFDIEQRDLTDGTIKLSGKDGFYPDGGVKHEYTGHTNLPVITELTLDGTSDGKTLALLPADYEVAGLYEYDGASGTGSSVSAENIDPAKQYCFRIRVKGDNLVVPNGSYTYTEPFEFVARHINETGAEGIVFKVKPKTSYNKSDTAAQYLAHITQNQNLVITDKKFGNEQLRAKDYKIEDKDIDLSRIHTDGVVEVTVHGQGCYDEAATVELYVGKNITLTMLKEKGAANDKPIILDAVPEGYDEAISGSVKLDGSYGDINQIPFLDVGGSDDRSNISLHDYTSGGKIPVVLYRGTKGQADGEYHTYVKSATPEPDNPDDTSGPRYCTVLITGKSGYYGTITVKVEVTKTDFNNGKGDYEIRFKNEYPKANAKEDPEDNVYKGKGIGVEPEFDVVRKGADPDPKNWQPGDRLILHQDYEIDHWDNNTVANEGKSGTSNRATLTVRGIYGYTGTITQDFTIYKRSIGVQSEVTNPDGSSAGQRWVMNSGFTIEGWKPNKSYDYTPSTKTETGEKKNVRPQLKLYYEGELLQEGVDYNIGYENNVNACCFDDNGVTYDTLPKVRFTTINGNMNSNFKGEFEDTFEIQPIILTDETKCKVTLSYEKTVFTGFAMEPVVKIVLYRDGDKTNPWTIEYDPAGGDFDRKYVENTFISVGGGSGSDPDNPFLTHVQVDGKGNLQGHINKQFVIYGEFEPKGSGANNSQMIVEPKILSYSPDATAADMKAGCVVTYKEKKDGYPDTAYEDPNKVDGRTYELSPMEYTVTVSNRIGKEREARVESAVDYLSGGKDFMMTIQGDLEADYIEYTVKKIDYSGADTVDLSKFLTVTYKTANGGKQELSYGTDYMFDRTPTANLGKNSLTIIPTPESKEYLINSRPIDYFVTASMDGLVLTNVADTYQYAHGQPVINPQDIIVELNGKKLDYGVDYKIEMVGDATSVGTHTIKVIGIGDIYSGTKEQSFTITPFNLEDAVRDKTITVNYNKTPVYTGDTVLPEVASVQIATSSGALYTLSDGTDKAKEYDVVAGGQGDHVNWTSGDVKPNFIIAGRGNYRGEIPYEYSIKRKDIGDSKEVIIAPIEDIYYNNGKDITPVPSIRYHDRDLAGILYSGNANDYVNWADYNTHFTYQYSTEIDLKSTGRKSILIRGIGNFTGEATVTYLVKPLNIKDTELTFTGEAPVYDGREQKPAFKLTYGGEVILEWTGSRVISRFINSADVKFGNNINATGEEPATVTISITGDSDNYEGTKETTFTILPATLTSHTKFMYRPVGDNGNVDLSTYKLNLDFIGVGSTVKPAYAESDADLEEGQVGIYYDFSQKANHGAFLVADKDYTIAYKYVEPDTDDTDVREDYQDPDISFAGKVKVTITGTGNYADTASFWYYIGKDISSDATISMKPTTAVYNSQVQAPEVKVSGVDGLKYVIAKYKDEVKVENLIEDRDFVNAGNYYIRIEGDPRNGTYATKPFTLTYTITARPLSNSLVIDGFKREYSYTGYEICPVGISVTDYIDNIKYRLTEDVDYTLTYKNNLNAGTAYITVKAQNNFSGSATASFMITSSTISSGSPGGSNSFIDQGIGEISGATSVSPSNVALTMDTNEAMYYTGKALYPKVSIAGMTENIDYTVTYSNNVEVGTGVITVNGIGNNTGSIVKNFRIIAQLSKCTVSPIPAQQHTGSPVTPSLTVTCGNTILMEGVDYSVSYANNVNIGTATATIRALNNANYVGSATVKFSIGNDVGGFIISGYAPSYTYTGKAITPGVVVETGSRTLTEGTDYTVTYSDNINAGTATITVTGIGKYSGTQTASFVIESRSVDTLTTSDVTDRVYTGDAYTPNITVSDGDKILTKGVDYTVTYTNNTNPGTASILIQGTSNNYSGTKIISFKISAVAVQGLKASSVKYNSLKLRWTKQGYADGYQICNSNSKVVKTVKGNSATITGLSAGKTYKYKVRSYIRNADGTKSYGAFSSVVSATTKLRTPTVKVVSNAKGQARITWSKVSGASGYEIYYKKSSKEKYKKLKTVNNANIRVCTVRGMKSGDRAYFRVRAFRKNGSKKVYSALNPLKVITVK